ncbi:hypothetical protein [Neobacillus sp. Marseille-QA0830]
MKRILLLVCLVFIFFLAGCGGSQSESKARDTVENYLELKKNGDLSSSEYIRYTSKDLIDVFNYKYLNTLKDTEEKYTESDNKDEFEAFYALQPNDSQTNPTWEQYVDRIHDKFGDDDNYFVSENGDSIEVTSNKDNTKSYTFLYDMEIANMGGSKIFKKVEFDVDYDYTLWDSDKEKYTEGFLISAIRIR